MAKTSSTNKRAATTRTTITTTHKWLGQRRSFVSANNASAQSDRPSILMPLVNAVLIKPDCYDPKQMPWRCHSCRFDTLTCQGGRALTNLIFMRGKNRVAPLERWKLRLAYQCEIINLNFAFAFAERKVNSGEREWKERMRWTDSERVGDWEKGKSNSICCIWGIYLSLGACQEQLSERQQTKQNDGERERERWETKTKWRTDSLHLEQHLEITVWVLRQVQRRHQSRRRRSCPWCWWWCPLCKIYENCWQLVLRTVNSGPRQRNLHADNGRAHGHCENCDSLPNAETET